MKIDKRGFLWIAGAGLAGLGLQPAGRALAAAFADQVKPSPTALQAKRWAMAVIPGMCKEDCADCFQACHLTHNVPDLGEKLHEIKWIWNEKFENAFPSEVHHEYVNFGWKEKNIVVMCNHCDNPPCVRVCPTQATFKRPEDGIVAMDYHRCIGCRFCIAACPYGSRSFNYFNPRNYLDKAKINPEFPTRMKGVVEKCNFCSERLAVGKVPACVEACKQGALVFGDLEDEASEIRRLIASRPVLRRKPELGTYPEIYYIS